MRDGMEHLEWPDGRQRCFWANPKNECYVRYHDEEWGRPVHDDGKLFEMLLLECFQAGLSWECVLNKREGFRRAFADFHLEKVCARVRPDHLAAIRCLGQRPEEARHEVRRLDHNLLVPAGRRRHRVT